MVLIRESNADTKGLDGVTAGAKLLPAKTCNYRFKFVGQKFRFLRPEDEKNVLSDTVRNITREDKLFRKGNFVTSKIVARDVQQVEELTVEQRLLKTHQVTVESFLRQLTIEENQLYNARGDPRYDPLLETRLKNSECDGVFIMVPPRSSQTSRGTVSFSVGGDHSTDEDRVSSSPGSRPSPLPRKDELKRVNAGVDLDTDLGLEYKSYLGESTDRLLIETEMASLSSSRAGSNGGTGLRSGSGHGSRSGSRGASRGGSRGGSRSGSREGSKMRTDVFVRGDVYGKVQPTHEPPAPGSLRARSNLVGGCKPKMTTKFDSLLISGVGEDILNSMSVIEEGTSVFEGSVLIEGESFLDRGSGSRASPTLALMLADCPARQDMKEMVGRGLPPTNELISGSDSLGNIGKDTGNGSLLLFGSGSEDGINQFNEERGHTAELYSRPDTAGYEECLAEELINFHYDDLGGESADEADEEPEVEEEVAVEEMCEADEECEDYEKKIEAVGVDMTGFPFFAPKSADYSLNNVTIPVEAEVSKYEGSVNVKRDSGDEIFDDNDDGYEGDEEAFHIAAHVPAPVPVPHSKKRLSYDSAMGMTGAYGRMSLHTHTALSPDVVGNDKLSIDIRKAQVAYRKRQQEEQEARIRAAAAAQKESKIFGPKIVKPKRSRNSKLVKLEEEEEESESDDAGNMEDEDDEDGLGYFSSDDVEFAATNINHEHHDKVQTAIAMQLQAKKNSTLSKEQLRGLAIAVRNIRVYYRNFGKSTTAATDATGIQEYISESAREVLVTPNTPYCISMLPLENDRTTGYNGGENIGPVLVHVGCKPLTETEDAGQGKAKRLALDLTLMAKGGALNGKDNTNEQQCQSMSAREYKRSNIETRDAFVKSVVRRDHISVPVTSRTDEELDVGSWRIRMPSLCGNKSRCDEFSGKNTVAEDDKRKSQVVTAQPIAPVHKVSASSRGMSVRSKKYVQHRSPVHEENQQADIDQYGNRLNSYIPTKQFSPPAPFPPPASVPSAPKYTKAHRRVVRTIVSMQQDEHSAALAAKSAKVNSKGNVIGNHALTVEHIAKLTSRATLDLKESNKHWVAHALTTQQKLARLPIAEAFAAYSLKETNRAPVCL